VVRNRTLLFALSLLAAISVVLSACDTAVPATTQLTDLDRLVNVISYEQFESLHQHPESSGYAYMDWSTDGCSAGPLGGSPYHFDEACFRHDFSWRNLKRITKLSGHELFTERNKYVADQRFLNDMKHRCDSYNAFVKPTCVVAAEGFYRAVRLVTPYASDQTLSENPHNFRW
jgi:hypothetical protein